MYLGIARAESVPSANAIKFWIRRLKKLQVPYVVVDRKHLER